MKSVILLKEREWSLHLLRVSSYLDLTEAYYPEEWLRAFRGSIRARVPVPILRKLADLPVTEYGDPIEYGIRAQLVAYFKKYDFSGFPMVTRAYAPETTAWKKFCAAEHRCMRVNSRILALRIRARTTGFDQANPTDRRLFGYYSLMEEMRRYIQKVLGEEPDLPEIYSLCDFGPGASIGNPRSSGTNIGRKLLSRRWSTSRSALSYAISALSANAHIKELLLSDNVCVDDVPIPIGDEVAGRVAFVEHNNIAFVPKSYKTFRSVAVEPLLNGFIQKGIDTVMRRRLLRFGVDLSDQSANSELARVGSVTGLFSTIDLSSASDTISRELVKHLLPSSWYELCDNVRSRSYSYRGKVARYHKFCSMGNGFCFPLQSLIFKAAVHAVGRMTGSHMPSRVYGDDIIVCKNDSLALIELLRFLGFTTNPDKTFVTGPFRESCGTDWYDGQDVRPVYFTEVRTNIDAYISHNQSYAWFLSPLLNEDRALLREVVPENWRFMRPFHGPGNTAFSVTRDLFMTSPYAKWRKDLYNWSWKELVFSTSPDDLSDIGDRREWQKEFVKYLAVLRGSVSSCPLARGGSLPRARVRRVSYWGSKTY